MQNNNFEKVKKYQSMIVLTDVQFKMHRVGFRKIGAKVEQLPIKIHIQGLIFHSLGKCIETYYKCSSAHFHVVMGRYTNIFENSLYPDLFVLQGDPY